MNQFVKQLVFSLFFSLLPIGVSDRQAGAQPAQSAQGAQPLIQVDVMMMPPVDNQELLERDKSRPTTGVPLRFAEPLKADVSPSEQGTWETLKDGSWLWRLRIVSPGALSINLGFIRYRMPPGGSLFLYTPDYGSIIGPFTEADNEEHGQLWTPLLPGDEIVVEVALPAAEVSKLELVLSSVNHGYLDFEGLGNKSGSCNVDVVCSQGDAWRDEIRSVAAYTISGIDTCSGALVNNTAQDRTPYFLTADHCGITSGNAPSVVVYWNYENSTCRTPGSPASGLPGDGSRAQFNSGAIFRAGYSPSDFTLVELDDPTDTAFNVHYAGWDNTSGDSSSAVTIHHPGVEEKRISFENDPTTTTSYAGTSIPGDGSHIRVIDWDLGTTEPGSSGSPLFNQDQRIVGQLHGGGAACGNDLSDWYGRFSVSWNGGGTSPTRLKDWLDPGDTGVTVLDGTDQQPDFTVDTTPSTRNVCVPDDAVFNVTIGSILGFSDPTTLSATGNPAGTSVNFSVNPVIPPGTSVMTITDTGAATAGSYSLALDVVAPTSTHSFNVTLNLFDSVPGTVSLVSPSDGAIDQSLTPTFEWSAATQGATYSLEVATDVAFSSLVYSTQLFGATSHTIGTNLASDTLHYWRVTPENSCGSGSTSTVFSFTTAVQLCSTLNLSIPDNNPTGVSDTLAVSSSGIIADLDVFIDILHTWVGDLIVTLEHVDTGTSVTLVDRPGYTGTGYGCGGDNIEATLNDEAASSVEDECDAGTPTIFGSFSPNNPLSAFDGETLSGSWTLTVSDNAGADFGTLLEWCLIPSLSDLPELSVSVPSVDFGNQDIDAGPTTSQTVTIENQGTADLNFTGAGIVISGTDAADFIITSVTDTSPLVPSASRTVDVAFDPSTPGARSANLRITTDDIDEATVNISLSGTGTEQEIDIVVSGGSLDFVQTGPGPTAPQTVSIENIGTATLSFTGAGVVINGTDASDFVISASDISPIPAGTTHTVDIVFDPAVLDGLPRAANLAITTDDFDESTVNVPLTGTAYLSVWDWRQY